MFLYRDTKEEDLEAICSLVKTPKELFYMFPSALYPLSVSQMKDILEKRKAHTTFLYGEEIIGYANLYFLEGEDAPYIGHLILSEKYRGRGYGKRMVEIMIRQAFALYKNDKIKIAVINENTKALLLYMKLGFSPFKASLRFDKRGEEKVLISMQLDMNKVKYGHDDLQGVWA
ncbi:MAG: GNAT family N-acetyltransferase [Epsilonproteobacteria bacterium]|nr:GNAT family N-acetyltransferase [Campylobacterota bacterium]